MTNSMTILVIIYITSILILYSWRIPIHETNFVFLEYWTFVTNRHIDLLYKYIIHNQIHYSKCSRKAAVLF